MENALLTKLIGGLPRLVRGERHPFAHFDWRGAVVQSNEYNFHDADRELLEIAMRA